MTDRLNRNAYCHQARCNTSYSLPLSLALKHYDFLKQEIQNLLNTGIIHKSMSPWVSPTVVVKKHTPEGSPKQSTFMTVFGKFKFLRLPFGLLQGLNFFTRLIYDLFGLNNSSHNSPGSGYLKYLDDILIYAKWKRTFRHDQ